MRDWHALVGTLKRRYFQRQFDWVCRAVLTTPAIELDESSNLVVLSQSYHKDLLMYLIAAKTFAQYIKPARFVIVDDGYTPEDQAIICKHLTRVDFIPRKSVSSQACPVGGCWERLLTIADICADQYVIQLDSDTVTIADPTEVRKCVENGVSFTLSTKQGQNFVPVEQASETVANSSVKHIQVYAEQALSRIPELAGSFYIRGCAGFAGFAPGAINREAVERISDLMSKTLGAKVWNSWGSEQFASNYLVANSPSKMPLPFEGYPYWELGGSVKSSKLIHFIGDNRFTSAAYKNIAMSAIRALR